MKYHPDKNPGDTDAMKKNLKKYPKHMKFCQTLKKGKLTMHMVTMHLISKVGVVFPMVSVDSAAFQTYLKTSSEIWAEGKLDKESREGKTLNTK